MTNTSLKPTLGFIGTGQITDIVVRGLLDHGDWPGPVNVSSRSKHVSTSLANDYDLVTIIDSNQDIAEQSDILFLAVLPAQAPAVLGALDLQPTQTLISLVADVTIAELLDISGHPRNLVHRAIPLPPNRFGVGPIPLFPSGTTADALLSRIGTVIAVDEETQFASFVSGSALMGMFFQLVASTARWLEDNGAPAHDAARYASTVFHALGAETTLVDAAGLSVLAEECLTPGGLNEQVLRELQAGGFFEQLEHSLDAILGRIQR